MSLNPLGPKIPVQVTVLIQVSVAQVAIERFEVRVLVWLSGLDQFQFDSGAVCPGQHGPAAELPTVVAPDRHRSATQRTDPIQKPRQSFAPDAVFQVHRYDFVCRVVTIAGHLIARTSATRSNTKSVDQTSFGAQGRISGCRSPTGIFLRCPALHLQALQRVQPVNPLVIGDCSQELDEARRGYSEAVCAVVTPHHQ